jgi:FAD/FMN-containing dehydrogenase
MLGTAHLVNDLHSGLNATQVAQIHEPRSAEDVQRVVGAAAVAGKKVTVCGGRHAMGGQQFGTDAVLIDMALMNKVVAFDDVNGTITVQGGMQWPQLIDYLTAQAPALQSKVWTIAQKQTGCDSLSIGGAISANVHGRGLKMKPFISDVISFDIVTADGALLTCSRSKNTELFSLAAGGYGLFGIIVSATMRLVPRTALKRIVEIVDCTEVMDKFEERIALGCLYGDFQFAIDDKSPDFLRKGVLSTYLPVPMEEADAASSNVALSIEQWRELLYLAHVDKSRAFDVYADHYMRTNGQTYWSDRFQLATYLDGYHRELDKRLCADHPASEIITELYVPREHLSDFLLNARHFLREYSANVIYGTVRLIERDDETFLPWAKEDYACIIFNLHTEHTTVGKDRSARAFRGLIDLATDFGGNYYLTYHKFAAREQLLACYRQFDEFIEMKHKYDPREVFSSDWYRHYAKPRV